MTLEQIIGIGIVVLVALFLIILFMCAGKNRSAVATLIVTFVIACGGVIFCRWYNTNTASGIRYYKDYQSELSNGIDREITIIAEDGREIFHYEGKVDVESDHEDNYIKFEGEDGKRYLIYYGVQDTIMIIEK